MLTNGRPIEGVTLDGHWRSTTLHIPRHQAKRKSVPLGTWAIIALIASGLLAWIAFLGWVAVHVIQRVTGG